MTSEAVPVTPDETRGKDLDVAALAKASRKATNIEMDGCPWDTYDDAYEQGFIDGHDVASAEVWSLRDQRDKALARVDELTARRRIPVPPPEPGMAATIADIGTGEDAER